MEDQVQWARASYVKPPNGESKWELYEQTLLQGKELAAANLIKVKEIWLNYKSLLSTFSVDSVPLMHRYVEELASLRDILTKQLITLSGCADNLRQAAMERVRNELKRVRKQQSQDDPTEPHVFFGSGSTQSVDALSDQLEGDSVDCTFMPLSSYEIAMIMGLMATHPLLVLGSENAILQEVCPAIKDWKKQLWRAARTQMLQYLPALIYQEGQVFFLISTTHESETLNLFWTARSWAKELTMMEAKSEASGYCCRMTVPVLRMSFS
jgi:hypothetical protein